MLYPWDMDRDIDIRAYFFRNRIWFFGTMIIAWCIDIPETLIKSVADLRPLPQEYFLFVGLHMGIAVTGIATRNKVVHLLLPIFWFVLTVYYVLMSTLGHIAG
ncbi:MAG: hypothetical protein OEV32_02945, partial [Gammaproteobacteria bacterium]|nr:hypothetical protein [Gammaproteobacteria bacterium]